MGKVSEHRRVSVREIEETVLRWYLFFFIYKSGSVVVVNANENVFFCAESICCFPFEIREFFSTSFPVDCWVYKFLWKEVFREVKIIFKKLAYIEWFEYKGFFTSCIVYERFSFNTSSRLWTRFDCIVMLAFFILANFEYKSIFILVLNSKKFGNIKVVSDSFSWFIFC